MMLGKIQLRRYKKPTADYKKALSNSLYLYFKLILNSGARTASTVTQENAPFLTLCHWFLNAEHLTMTTIQDLEKISSMNDVK